jgi:hydrogenase expression/formation protein HypD
MKYVDEFRDTELARRLAARIRQQAQPSRHYRVMEFCGGHTHAVFRYGLPALLPDNVELIHGPGCPVCVLPVARLQQAIELSRLPDVILCSYGDMLRVPAGRGQSLLRARAEGADIRMLYSPLEALTLAQQHPDAQVVFFAIGFETTTPSTAVLIQRAQALGINNLSVLCNHVLTPAAMHAILTPSDGQAAAIDGFIGPAHVSTVIGSEAYAPFPLQYGKPVVIAGFEPLDLLQAVSMLVDQINHQVARVENQFSRAVRPDGNLKARAQVEQVFETRDRFEWRGLGEVPSSALKIRSEYARYDAEQRFALDAPTAREHPGCECPAVLRGQIKPPECRLFGHPCTPDNPLGACMVSSEGACAAWYRYNRGPIERLEGE